MLRNAMILGVLAGVFAGGHAATWQAVYTAPTGTIWIDRDTLSVEPPLVYVRLRISLAKPSNPGDVFYDRRDVRLIFQCATWQYSMISDTKWLHGKLMKRWEGDTEYVDLDPDSLWSEAAKTLCKQTSLRR
ncbi:hypothetical protein [Paraburkholderia sp. J8-2]|uniref:hypothetical protein n=1 Tax=Paraburkholderia sp. J8-2 TaxID=2805440 RepID=UPI002AB69CB2|nr:hypothetical protein [Paraburkholderia sp. J8-2]